MVTDALSHEVIGSRPTYRNCRDPAGPEAVRICRKVTGGDALASLFHEASVVRASSLLWDRLRLSGFRVRGMAACRCGAVFRGS